MKNRSGICHAPKLLLAIVTAAVVFLPDRPAVAQDSARDAECFLISNMFSRAKDAKAKEVATQATFFYLGRLRGTSAEIEAAMVAQAKAITPENAGTKMNNCAQAMGRRATEVRGVTQRIGGKTRK